MYTNDTNICLVIANSSLGILTNNELVVIEAVYNIVIVIVQIRKLTFKSKINKCINLLGFVDQLFGLLVLGRKYYIRSQYNL